MRAVPGGTPSKAGAVLELKSIDTDRGETAQTALAAAMAQFHDRQCCSAAGAEPISLWAVVFDGKRIWGKVESG